MSFTKETKPTTSFTKEVKFDSSGGFDEATFDSAAFDTFFVKETKPTSSFTKETKPT